MKKILTLLTLIFTGSFFVHSQEKMEVDGAINIKDSQASNPEEGTIQWDGTDFLGWNGIHWVSLTNYGTLGTVTDVEGNTYQTVRIGDQIWMAENLRTKSYNDNSDIPEVTDNATWAGLTTGARCWYNNNPSTEHFLYNWHAVDSNILCPTDWHVPSDSEWDILAEYLGGTFIASGKMKEIGIVNWASPNTGASNESGFTAKPNGHRKETGFFNSAQNSTSGMWSSTEVGSESSTRVMTFNQANLLAIQTHQNFGFTVRCLKD